MVRFARSEGSKASNKREPEEATPWLQMVDGDRTNTVTPAATVQRKKRKTDTENTKQSTTNITADITPSPVKEDCATAKKKDILRQQGNIEVNVEGQKKKRKKKKDSSISLTVKPKEFSVNAQGQRVKVFKDGAERTWFDLPYEEGERMTRYDNMWVKREMVAKLDQLKQSLTDQDLTQQEMMRKMMKAKRKAHRELRIELIYEQKALVKGQQQGTSEQPRGTSTKERKKTKVRNNDTTIKWRDDNDNIEASFGEMEGNQEEMEESSEELKGQSEEIEGGFGKVDEKYERSFRINVEQDNNRNKHSNFDRGSNFALRPHTSEEFSRETVVTENEDTPKCGTGNSTKAMKSLDFDSHNSSVDFEENELMTCYDGYWVLRSAVEKLDAAKKVKLQDLLAARTDSNTSQQLTPAEKIIFQRAIKKDKRFQHKLLLRKLSQQGSTPRPKKQWQQQERGEVEEKSDEVVKFDGFWVKKDSAVRLTKLRQRLVAEGLSQEELQKVIQKERRKEERLLKNERSQVCLKCRQPGHMVSACPEATEVDGTQVAICYTCGSTEHTVKDCSLKRKGSEFSHATCFICREVGHISRECPDNPRGLYPNGGACRTCGSVEHLAKNCPDLQEEQEKNVLTAQRMDGSKVEALDEDMKLEMERSAACFATQSKAKHIFFD